jgi:hypothetical protein
MNTLREAVRDYLDMRRSLGFKLREAEQRADRFRQVSRAAQRQLHHPGIGTGLGATTLQRSTGLLGPSAAFRTRIRTLSQRH